jgi:toxin YhaV
MVRRRRQPQRRKARPATGSATARDAPIHGDATVQAHGWTILAHPLFLEKMEKLIGVTEQERAHSLSASPGPNEKLLTHLLDLAFDKIPGNPASPQYRHGGTLDPSLKHWFRGKTGNGRYRLFFRYDTSEQLILYAWVNDEQSLRTYGSSTDAYATFARMLRDGNPPDSLDGLKAACRHPQSRARLGQLATRPHRATSGKKRRP